MLQEIPENHLYLCSKQTSQRSFQNARKAFFMGTTTVIRLVAIRYFTNKQTFIYNNNHRALKNSGKGVLFCDKKLIVASNPLQCLGMNLTPTHHYNYQG